jgi:hypothetical protein
MKRLITTPIELDELISAYNQRNPFEHLNISGIASKALYERITGIYSDLKIDIVMNDQIPKLPEKNNVSVTNSEIQTPGSETEY